MARQDARVTTTYLPDPLLTLGVSGGYLESNKATATIVSELRALDKK